MREKDGQGQGRQSSVWPPSWWSTLISLNGMALAWYEAIFSQFDRPYVLALAAAMIGVLPAQLIDAALRRSGR
jgi:hypothetical protein